MTAQFFVVRHKATGRLMPAVSHPTAVDFQDLSIVQLAPRLFLTKRGALNAASAWTQGIWKTELSRESDGWENPSYMVQSTPYPVPQEGRAPGDLEVVPATLTF